MQRLRSASLLEWMKPWVQGCVPIVITAISVAAEEERHRGYRTQNTRARRAPATQEPLNTRPFQGAQSTELSREVSAQQPTPGFLPGKSHGQRSLVGYDPWGRKELDTRLSD